MERKIGEIFEYNGEWYQTVEASFSCHPCNECQGCIGMGGPRIFGGECNGNARKDGKFVIFKRLEKVGQPYTTYVDKIVQNYLLETAVSVPPKVGFTLINNEQRLIAIEIKQTKENMEENHKVEDTPLTRLVGRYVNNLIDYETFEKAVKELYVDKEESKQSLKEFDLEAAKADKPVCTRDGRKARIICFDRIDAKPILALVPSTDGKGEDVFDYFVSGKRIANALESDLDLMMRPEKKEGWMNVYKDGLLGTRAYNTKKEAFDNASPSDYVDTVKISWEE